MEKEHHSSGSHAANPGSSGSSNDYNSINLNAGHVHHAQPDPAPLPSSPPVHHHHAEVNGGGMHHSNHHGSSYLVSSASTSSAPSFVTFTSAIPRNDRPLPQRNDLNASHLSLYIDADYHGISPAEEKVARGLSGDACISYIRARSTNNCYGDSDDEDDPSPPPTPPSPPLRSRSAFRGISTLFRGLLKRTWRRNYSPVSHVDLRFDYPRGGDNDRVPPTIEIQQFIASQRLFSPNQPPFVPPAQPPAPSQPPPPVPMDVDDAPASGDDENTQSTATVEKKTRKRKKSQATKAAVKRSQHASRKSTQTTGAASHSFGAPVNEFATLNDALSYEQSRPFAFQFGHPAPTLANLMGTIPDTSRLLNDDARLMQPADQFNLNQPQRSTPITNGEAAAAQNANEDSVAAETTNGERVQLSNELLEFDETSTSAKPALAKKDESVSTNAPPANVKNSTSSPSTSVVPPKQPSIPDVWEDDKGIIHVVDVEVSNSSANRVDPRVIQINDVDYDGGPVEYPDNEPNFDGVLLSGHEGLLLRDIIRIADDENDRNLVHGEQISAWHAAYIPHLSFNVFNRIAYIDPLFAQTPQDPILGYLRMFRRGPELIQCPLHIHGNHWTLLSINVVTNVATYYDPLVSKSDKRDDEEGKSLSRQILAALELAGIIEPRTDFVIAPLNTYNQQEDGCSCGYFVMLISEDIARYGHSIRHTDLNIVAERHRINLILHRLYNVNNERGLNERRVSIPDWPELPNRERVMSQQAARLFTQLPAKNSLIKKVNAKPITKKLPKEPVRRSDRIAAQPKVLNPKIQASRIKSFQQRHIPIGLNSCDIYPPEDDQGPMTKRCKYCNAYLFEGEESNKCCAEGTVPPPNNPRVPGEYVNLTNFHEFMSNIRSYNSLFAMVSTSADMHMTGGVFKIQGEPRHNVGDLVPVPGQHQQFAQNYTIDADDAIANRHRDFQRLGYKGKEAKCEEVIALIEIMLRKYHPCVQELKTMKQKLAEYEDECQREGKEVRKLYIVWEDPQVAASGGTHPGRLNPPTMPGQVFNVFRSEDGEPPRNGIYFGVNSHGSNKLREVPFYSGNVDAAAYPLIFLFGQAGWTQNIPKLDPNAPAAQAPAPPPASPQPAPQQQPNPQPSQPPTSTQQVPQPPPPQPLSSQMPPNEHPSTQQPAQPSQPQGFFAQASQLASAVVTQATQVATAVGTQVTQLASVIATQSTQVATQIAEALNAVLEDDEGSDDDVDKESENDENAEKYVCDASSDEEVAENKRTTVSQQQHYRSQLFDRTEDQKLRYNTITGSRQLSQQFHIEAYSKVEQQRLEFQEKVIEDNKDRYDQNDKVREYLQSEINKVPQLKGKDLGKVVMMPRKYRGGNRYMHHKFRSGIAINDRYGKDDLFITFTGNPTWEEITQNLRPGETWIDRPDLVCRVFNLKAREFINDITTRGVLGKVKAFKIALEHQKRGMPHLHILLTMEEGYKFKTAEAIDEIISAQLPRKPELGEDNYDEKLRYYDYVLKLMIHDPSRCAASCGKGKKDGKCGKGFGKDFCDRTIIKRDGYAQVCRPNDGRVIQLKKNNRQTVEIDNQWVVAHNRFLLLKYNCHINVEHCGGAKALKYLHKYLHKGHDKAFISVREAFKYGKQPTGAANATDAAATDNVVDYNEIHQHRCLRLLGSPEAVERLLGMFITKQSHFVKELPVHLPDQHNIRFKENEPASSVLSKTQQLGTQRRGSRPVSELTAFFDLVRQAKDAEDYDPNNDDPTAPQNLYYHQIYELYHYSKKKWHKRIYNKKCLGRLQSVFPSNVELFCLRELLKAIKAPTCFEDLLQCGTESFETFQECAVAHRLYIDDQICYRTMDEVKEYAMARQCRRTFAMLLLYCKPKDAQTLWNKFEESLIDRPCDSVKSFTERRRRAYAHVASILYHHGISMSHVGLPFVTDDDILSAQYDTFSRISTDGDERYATMNRLQRHFTDSVLRSLDNVADRTRDRLFFLQGSGGCGKSYVFNTLTRILQANGYKVLVVASTGIAAILLDNGRTAHSAFRIPLDIHKEANISKHHPIGRLIGDADVIIWDEAPMQHKSVLERANKIVKQLVGTENHHSIFGNKTVILGGDFKQILPVVVKENVRASFDASILCSDVFRKNFKLFELLENKRAEEDPEYAAWLQDIGSGLGASSTFGHHQVQLNDDMVEYREDAVIDFVYPPEIFELELPQYIEYVKDAALMAPLNEKVFDINHIIISRLDGDAKVYTAVNSLPKAEYEGDEILQRHYDTDELNQFEHSSIPKHQIQLRVRTVVMLTRNLDVNYGMCNGTRMVVTKLYDHHIQCQLITGSRAGEIVSIFPMPNIYNEPDEDWPSFSRVQLPIRTAFAITINKSQGQSLKKVGVLLESPCFAHGQLYVALSRVGNRKNIKIYVNQKDVGIINEGTPEERRIPHAQNIVYPEVIQQLKFLTVKIPQIAPLNPSQVQTSKPVVRFQLSQPLFSTVSQTHRPQTRSLASAPPQITSQRVPPPPKPVVRQKPVDTFPQPRFYDDDSEDSSDESSEHSDDGSLSSLPIDDGMFDEPEEITPSQINRAFLPDAARVTALIDHDNTSQPPLQLHSSPSNALQSQNLHPSDQLYFDEDVRMQALIAQDPAFFDHSFPHHSQQHSQRDNTSQPPLPLHSSPSNAFQSQTFHPSDQIYFDEDLRIQALLAQDPNFFDNSYPRSQNGFQPVVPDDDGITDAVADAEVERLNGLLGQDDFDWEGQLDY